MYNSAVVFLDQTAETQPDNIAIVDGNVQLTYRDLQQMALAVGSGIISQQPKWNICVPIAVFMPKSYAAVISFMGILYSGNTYVPIDDKMPLARLQKILENLEPQFIIADQPRRDLLLTAGYASDMVLLYEDLVKAEMNREKTDFRVQSTIDTNPIYIMYTSGSTGTPKGVVIPHRGVVDYAHWVVETFGIDANSHLGSQAPFYFDNSVLDIYSCLLTGAKLNIIPDVLFQFPIRLPAYLQAEKIDTIFWVPTVMINVANSGILSDPATILPDLKRVLFCGEAMPNKQLNRWRQVLPQALFANLYGPTEITDVCTYYIVEKEFLDSDPLPIGQACRNMKVLILNEHDRQAAVNEIGELCVLGTGLAWGYWHRPDLTEAAFVNNPLHCAYAEKIYRTGDLVYQDDSGVIMFVGRKDSQIKHKGNRIELGEIETMAKSLPTVENVCVLYDDAIQEIVMFLETQEVLEPKAISRSLLQMLPKYMIPGHYIQMEKLPYNANGKIDRVKLKEQLPSVTGR